MPSASLVATTSLGAALALAEIALLLAPVMAVVLYFAVASKSQHIFRAALAGASLVLAAILISSKLGFGFQAPIVNLAFVAISYLAFCYVVASCLRLRLKYIRISALALLSTPIFFGYVLATIGFLGLGWIVGDVVAAPYRMETIAPNLTCEMKMWGAAAGNSGYNVTIYRVWSFAPFLRRQVVNISVNQNASDKNASCADALAAYEK